MRRRWRLHVINSELDRTADDLRSVRAQGADAIVAHGIPDAASWAAMEGFAGPTVVIGMLPPVPSGVAGPVMVAEVDNAAVGRAGAAHLESLGTFRAFGFVGGDNAPVRAEAFRAALLPRHQDVRIYEPDAFGDADAARLGEWLAALPRPAAVMAAQDAMALVVLDAAASAGLQVPKDLAVLGVDNDELLCETAEPPLTSIAIDHVRLGELAAEEMRRMLEQPGSRPLGRLAPVRGVVERQSARSLAPTAALARRAAAWIRHNAGTCGIGAADVARSMGASRSLLDQRFRKTTGESVQETIRRVRLEAVCAKLRSSSLPIGQIARSCGFASETHAMRLFKARYGCTMRQWRRSRGG
jgi:LacI family transcriptional regulator